MNAFSWRYRLYLRWVMPVVVRLGQAWFRRNHTYRTLALKGLWGAALAAVFVTVGMGVDQDVGVQGAVFWVGGMVLAMGLLWAWFYFNARVFALVPVAASDVGGQVIRSFGWTAQSWRLSWWDLVWLRCLPTPEQWVHARAVKLGAALPAPVSAVASKRERF